MLLKLNFNNYQKNILRFVSSTNQGESESNFNVKILFGLVDCFTDKCKKLKKNFQKPNFPTTNKSLSFKFNFYKALCDLNIESNFNVTQSEFFYMKKFKSEISFKIIECDKNIGVSFKDTSIYNKFAIEQLTYLRLNKDPLKDVMYEKKLNF